MKSIVCTSLFVLLLFVSAKSLRAQENLFEGYILTHEGEVIHGYLDDIFKEGTNPSKIVFRNEKTGPGKEYDPYSIKSFSINGIVYEGGFITIESSSRDLSTLSNSPELKTEDRLTFLQAIFTGDKSLYVYKSAIADNYYIKTDSVFELLEYKKYMGKRMVSGETRNVVIENKKYTGQLSLYLTGCPELKSEITKTRYDQKSLTKLYSKYYNCTKEEFRAFNPKRVPLIKAGVMASYSLSKLNYNFIAPNIHKGSEATSAYGLGLSVQGRVSPDLFFIGELSYSRPYTHRVEPIIYKGPNYSVESNYSYYATSRKISLLARYQIPVNKIIIFANAGYASERIFGKFDFKQTTSYTLSSTNFTNKERGKLKSTNLLAGAGVRYSNLSFESRIEPTLMNKYHGTTVSFIFSYILGNTMP